MRFAGDGFLQRLDGARFADPGLANQRHDLAFAATRETPAVEYQPHFVSAADERNAAAAAARCKARHHRRFADYSPGLHRASETFQVVRASGLKLEQSAEQILRHLADEYRIGRRQCLKPRGEVRGFADDGALLRGARADNLADDDQTCRDADARL